jgi:hypothetical protein
LSFKVLVIKEKKNKNKIIIMSWTRNSGSDDDVGDVISIAMRVINTNGKNFIELENLDIATEDCSDEVRVKVWNLDKLANVLLNAGEKGATNDIKEAALSSISNIAIAEANGVPMYNTPRLMPLLMEAAEKGATNDIKAASLGVLWNLSEDADIRLPMLNTPRLVSLLMSSTKSNDDEIVSSALATFRGLSVSPDAKRVLDTPEIIQMLTTKMKHKDIIVRVRAIQTLACIIGSDEPRSHLLQSNNEILKSIVGVVKAATTHGEYADDIDWHFSIALPPVVALSIVPSNRRILAAAGILPILVSGLLVAALENDIEGVENIITILQQFSFDDDSLQTLRNDSKLNEYLKQVTSKSNDEKWSTAIRRAGYLTFRLSGKSEDTTLQQQPSSSSSSKKNIMISYSWANQQVGRDVDTFLTKAGYHVWRDEHDMKGDIVEAMTGAVLNSDTIVVLVSESYYKSANCQTEVKFAFTNKKRIIPLLVQPGYVYQATWLGLILKSALYYEIVPENKFQQGMLQMEKNELNGERKSITKQNSAVTTVQVIVGTPVPRNGDEIRTWLKSIDLQEIYDKFENEGYIGEKKFKFLISKDAASLKTLLGVKGIEASQLEEALKAVVWEI